ncbi:hypothetical protein P154DRAFT_619150 [Amniculicola lignicola CBS 123094]|uniref:Uncharacterized protein n=1 Tax=Amniculicola lignicola CBS 123094 TaxID=1392246 RepID=A0A6A5WIV7_9PLEO|nr:hypothetical protein P154DRAFT_619150 [Amniculicola lignicola CBS 123094]
MEIKVSPYTRPLNYAAVYGTRSVTEALLDYGADIRPNKPLIDVVQADCLVTGNRRMVRFLLERGAEAKDLLECESASEGMLGYEWVWKGVERGEMPPEEFGGRGLAEGWKLYGLGLLRLGFEEGVWSAMFGVSILSKYLHVSSNSVSMGLWLFQVSLAPPNSSV